MSPELSTAISRDTVHSVNWWRRAFARLWLGLTGWRVEGTPPGPKIVLIAAPHTTNWDLPFTLAAAWRLGLHVHWLGKDSLFRPPFGTALKWLGGIPVDRSSPRGIVDQIADRFARSEKLVVAVPPSATRSKAPCWRSGFYWIAHGASVPVVCAYLDYRRKVGGLGPSFVPSGNVREDMDRIRTFYGGIDGKYPERATPIRLRAEMPTPDGESEIGEVDRPRSS